MSLERRRLDIEKEIEIDLTSLQGSGTQFFYVDIWDNITSKSVTPADNYIQVDLGSSQNPNNLTVPNLSNGLTPTEVFNSILAFNQASGWDGLSTAPITVKYINGGTQQEYGADLFNLDIISYAQEPSSDNTVVEGTEVLVYFRPSEEHDDDIDEGEEPTNTSNQVTVLDFVGLTPQEANQLVDSVYEDSLQQIFNPIFVEYRHINRNASDYVKQWTYDEQETSEQDFQQGYTIIGQQPDPDEVIPRGSQFELYVIRTDRITDDDSVAQQPVEFDKTRLKQLLKSLYNQNVFQADLESVDITKRLLTQEFSESSRFLRYKLYNDRGGEYLSTNYVDGGSLNQIESEIDELGSIVVKMYQPVDDLDVTDTVIYSKIARNGFSVDVDITDNDLDDELLQLTPNFQGDVDRSNITVSSTYKSFNELVGNNTSVYDKVIDYYISSKNDDIQLNVEYNNFNNFVRFGSAYERLVNFKYKLQEIEEYENKKLTATSAESARLDEKIRLIKASFDEYEYFLFSDSESTLYIDDVYVFEENNLLASWPRDSGNTLYAVNDPVSVTWFNRISEVAREYDNRNVDSLRNNTPEFIREDNQSSEYILFIDMIGQVYDYVWLYSKELNKMYEWEDNPFVGLSSDLSSTLIEAYGNNLDIGFSEKDVWEYILGTDSSDSSISSDVAFNFKNKQRETIRRILANLPHLLQYKGTNEAIKALVASYGIPSSTLFIKEFGTFQTANSLQISQERENLTKELEFSTGQSISLSSESYLNGSSAVEMMVRFNSIPSSTVVLFQGSSVNGSYTISVEPVDVGNGVTHGRVLLDITDGAVNFNLTSNTADILNGELTNIVVQYEGVSVYGIYIKQFDYDDREFYVDVYSFDNVGPSIVVGINNAFENIDSFVFGASGVTSFADSLAELRIWADKLNSSSINEHTKFPNSITIEDPLQIPSSLLVRASFSDSETSVQAENSNNIPNLVFNPTYPVVLNTSAIAVSDFNTVTRRELIDTANIGSDVIGNNKVRYELNQVLQGNTLTPNMEDSPYESNLRVSNQILDSDKLVVGFSPTDITNEIILSHFGATDFTDEFGSPLDTYETEYADLKSKVESFFNNVSDDSNKKTAFFLQYIRNFDKTIFENIRQFVPERSDFLTSIFIEPHILDRSKAKRLGQSELRDLYESANPIEQPVDVGGSSDDVTGRIGIDPVFKPQPIIIPTQPISAISPLEMVVGQLLGYSQEELARAVISLDEIRTYLSQDTNIILLTNTEEDQILINNQWDYDTNTGLSSVYAVTRNGVRIRFFVYKFDFYSQLQTIENQIAALSSIDIASETAQYLDLVRLHEKYRKLNGRLFLLRAGAPLPPGAVAVDYSDLIERGIRPIIGEGVIGENPGNIGGVEVDPEEPVVTIRVENTRTIVTDPDDDIKLTVR